MPGTATVRSSFVWPRADLAGTLAGKDLAKLAAEHAELNVEAGKAKRQVVELRDIEAARATRADTAAYAAAIRAGSPDPGPVNQRKTAADLEQADRHLAGLPQARDDVSNEAAKLLANRADAWRQDAERKAGASHKRFGAAVAELQAAADEHRARLGVEMWLSDEVGVAGVPDVPGLGTAKLSLTAVLAGLQQLLHDWRREG